MVLYPNKLPESERVCSGICNIIDIYKYIYVMDVYNREAFSNLHISCVLHDCQFWI